MAAIGRCLNSFRCGRPDVTQQQHPAGSLKPVDGRGTIMVDLGRILPKQAQVEVGGLVAHRAGSLVVCVGVLAEVGEGEAGLALKRDLTIGVSCTLVLVSRTGSLGGARNMPARTCSLGQRNAFRDVRYA